MSTLSSKRSLLLNKRQVACSKDSNDQQKCATNGNNPSGNAHTSTNGNNGESKLDAAASCGGTDDSNATGASDKTGTDVEDHSMSAETVGQLLIFLPMPLSLSSEAIGITLPNVRMPTELPCGFLYAKWFQSLIWIRTSIKCCLSCQSISFLYR